MLYCNHLARSPYWIANRTKLSKMWFSLAGLPINSLSQCRSNHQLPDVSNSSNFNLIIYLYCDYRGFGKRAGKQSLVFCSLKFLFTGLKVRSQKKNDIIWEFFPTWGGVFPNPKTFVNLPSIFLYAKFILRC